MKSFTKLLLFAFLALINQTAFSKDFSPLLQRVLETNKTLCVHYLQEIRKNLDTYRNTSTLNEFSPDKNASVYKDYQNAYDACIKDADCKKELMEWEKNTETAALSCFLSLIRQNT